MKIRTRRILAILLVVAVWTGCQNPSPVTETAPAGGETDEKVVASVNGVTISSAEVDEAAKGQLQKLLSQIYQVRKQALDGLVEQMLVEKAAKEKGVSKESYVEEQIRSKVAPPTEEEVKEFYEKQKARIRAPFEQVKEKIVEHLKNQRLEAKRQEVVALLKKEADVKVMLEPPRVRVALDGAAYTTGNGEAKIEMVEFSDYECPYSMASQLVVSRVLDEYKGKIIYAFFDYPLPFHQKAKKAHAAARCAGEQGKYAEYGKKLFANQKKLEVENLKKYAEELELDVEAFRSCLASDKVSASVQQSFEKGNRSGVSGTPAFFINGIMISGAQPLEAFKEIIESELAR